MATNDDFKERWKDVIPWESFWEELNALLSSTFDQARAALESENSALTANLKASTDVRNHFLSEIERLEAENAALKARPTYTHGYEDGKDSRHGEIDALKAEIQVLFNAFPWSPTSDGTPALTAVENAIYQYESLRAKLERAEKELMKAATLDGWKETLADDPTISNYSLWLARRYCEEPPKAQE